MMDKRKYRLKRAGAIRGRQKGDVVELTESAARYLLLRGWIEPEPAPPPARPRAARKRRKAS